MIRTDRLRNRVFAVVAVAALTTVAVNSADAQPLGLQGGGFGTAGQFMNSLRLQNSTDNFSVFATNRNTLDRGTAVFNGFGVSTGLSGASQARAAAPRARATSSKPFSSVSRRPSISPYLSLFNETLDDNFDTYNTLVRPQLQQQRVNDQLQRQTQQLNARFQELSAQPSFNPQGSQQALATGHPTFFNNTLNYYPLRNQRRR